LSQPEGKENTDMKMPEDDGACVFGAAILRKHYEALKIEIDGVRQAKDIEYIHRMRVASRRLRTVLPMFITCFPARKGEIWLKEIKKITRSLGAARDTDVQIETVEAFYAKVTDPRLRRGIRRLILRLKQKRARCQGKINATLDELEQSQTLIEIDDRTRTILEKKGQVYLYSPRLFQMAFISIMNQLNELLSYENYIFQPEYKTELHMMRIAAKYLRYSMETFASLYTDELKPYIVAIRTVQELLGNIHDSDVWIDFLPQFIQDETRLTLRYFGSAAPARRIIPGIECFLEDRKNERERLYQEFCLYWQELTSKDLWNLLKKNIQIPYTVKENQENGAQAAEQ